MGKVVDLNEGVCLGKKLGSILRLEGREGWL